MRSITIIFSNGSVAHYAPSVGLFAAGLSCSIGDPVTWDEFKQLIDKKLAQQALDGTIEVEYIIVSRYESGPGNILLQIVEGDAGKEACIFSTSVP